MRTDLGHEVLVTERIDLRGRIANAVVKDRLHTNGLVLRALQEEQRQLSGQNGPVKFTHIFERNDRYNFGLTSVYLNDEMIRQLLLSIGKEGDIRTYHVMKGPMSGVRLFRYDGTLTRDGIPYSGVSQDDGVAEVLLGERRVSHQPH